MVVRKKEREAYYTRFRKLNQRISASIKDTPRRETCVQGTPRRGNEHIAQGNALGGLTAASAPCKGKSVSTERLSPNAFAPSGRICGGQLTQGDALGYALVAPSLTLQLFSEPIGELINI